MRRELLRTILADQRADLLEGDFGEVPRLYSLEKHLNSPEISVITGVRRCGKSTLLRQIARACQHRAEIHYLNFEELRLSAFQVEDFQSAYEEFLVTCPSNVAKILIYDEIQLVLEWEKWVAGLSSKKDIKVFITGSNSKLLGSELSSLITGRYMTLHVTPFSFAEILANKTAQSTDSSQKFESTAAKIDRRRAFSDYMKYGGFPRAYLGKDTALLADYYNDIITKDIALRRKVRNVSALKALGSILAAQNTRLFNRASVTKDIALKSPLTVSKFCDYFQETYLYSELRLFSTSRRGQLRGKSKYFAVDPLLAKEIGYHHSNTDYWVIENHVYNDLRRRMYEVFYWHSKDGYEVDFIARRKNEALIGIQVSLDISSRNTLEREVRGLTAAKAELGIKEALIITQEDLDLQSSPPPGITIIPFFDWAARQ